VAVGSRSDNEISLKRTRANVREKLSTMGKEDHEALCGTGSYLWEEKSRKMSRKQRCKLEIGRLMGWGKEEGIGRRVEGSEMRLKRRRREEGV